MSVLPMCSPKIDESTYETFFKSYRIIRLLGYGGDAHVYLADHLSTHTRVALKVPRIKDRQEAQNRILREAQILARINNSYVVPFYDAGIENNTPFLAMGYAPYGTVRQYHSLQRPLQVTTVICYLKQVAHALQSIHNDGLIHQDVKSENLLLAQPERIWLSDFSIAMSAKRLCTSESVAGAGTGPYMAPEQLRGMPCQASDQYALAIVVYEWLCGKTPFRGTSLDVMRQHIYTPPPSITRVLPSLSPQVDRVMRKALAKDPCQRFSSVQAFASALEVALMRRSARYIAITSRRYLRPARSLATEPPLLSPINSRD